MTDLHIAKRLTTVRLPEDDGIVEAPSPRDTITAEASIARSASIPVVQDPSAKGTRATSRMTLNNTMKSSAMSTIDVEMDPQVTSSYLSAIAHSMPKTARTETFTEDLESAYLSIDKARPLSTLLENLRNGMKAPMRHRNATATVPTPSYTTVIEHRSSDTAPDLSPEQKRSSDSPVLSDVQINVPTLKVTAISSIKETRHCLPTIRPDTIRPLTTLTENSRNRQTTSRKYREEKVVRRFAPSSPPAFSKPSLLLESTSLSVPARNTGSTAQNSKINLMAVGSENRTLCSHSKASHFSRSPKSSDVQWSSHRSVTSSVCDMYMPSVSSKVQSESPLLTVSYLAASDSSWTVEAVEDD